MATKGCQSFNFKGSSFKGTCVVVAPSVGDVAITGDFNEKDWNYYGWFHK